MNIMKKEETRNNRGGKTKGQPYRVRLPGFISDEEIGLGDAIKRVTSSIGIKPCGGCERRASALNGWLVFSGRRFK
jgi:hypothetical protein